MKDQKRRGGCIDHPSYHLRDKFPESEKPSGSLTEKLYWGEWEEQPPRVYRAEDRAGVMVSCD